MMAKGEVGWKEEGESRVSGENRKGGWAVGVGQGGGGEAVWARGVLIDSRLGIFQTG